MPLDEPQSELGQIGLLVSVWRYRYLVLVMVVISGLAAAVVTTSANSSARAEATIALTDPRGNSLFRQGSAANVDLTRYTAERAAFAESDAVLSRAAEIVGGGATANSLADKVNVKPSPSTSILSITATAPTMRIAKKISDATAQAYQELAGKETQEKVELALSGLEGQRSEAQLIIANPKSTPAEVSAGTQTLSAVNARAAEIQSAGTLFGSGVAFANPAKAVPTGGTVALVRNGVAGSIIGLVLGSALAWVLADRAMRRIGIAELALEDQDGDPRAQGVSSLRSREREVRPLWPPPKRRAQSS